MPRDLRSKNPSRKYSLQKAYLKIMTYRPSRSLIAAILIAIAIFLLGGGVYDVFRKPPPVLLIGAGRYLAYYPYNINEQLLVGSIGVMILYALGSLGLILIYHSTRYMHYSRRHSLIFIWIGVALLLISFIIVESIMFWILH